jgi:VWFA-related protein
MKIVRILMLILIGAGAWGQAPAPPVRGASTDRPIVLDVVVTDKAGSPVSGLQQSDFTVLDDKQPQSILQFLALEESQSFPQQVIFLIDAVNSSYRGVSNARQQLEKYLRQGEGPLPVPMSLIIFTDKTAKAQASATRDRTALLASLHSAESGLRSFGRSGGFYGGAEHMQLSLNTLEKLTSFAAKEPGRKLLIWLSPGWPLLSGPFVEMTEKQMEETFHFIVRISTEMREAHVALYSIDPAGLDDAGGFRTFYYENFLKGVVSPGKVQNGNLGLQVIATQSGGRVLNADNDIATLIASCVADTKAYYILSFAAADADHPDEYHNLQVKIDKPGLTARTRTGYYAQKRVPTK